MSIIAFERFSTALGQNGTPTLRFAEFLEEITRQVNNNTEQVSANLTQINASTMRSGIGSPEGVLIAPPKTLYMDEIGLAGSVLYVKQTGVGDAGWVLI